MSGHSVCWRFGVSDFPASNPAFSRGRQLVPFQFENHLPLPEYQHYQQQTCFINQLYLFRNIWHITCKRKSNSAFLEIYSYMNYWAMKMILYNSKPFIISGKGRTVNTLNAPGWCEIWGTCYECIASQVLRLLIYCPRLFYLWFYIFKQTDLTHY